jgi:UDP-N-acetyl-alpha-D-muramoyl-L-alanyl-L-glutamate epimerase
MTTDPQNTFSFLSPAWSPEKREAAFSYKLVHNGETFTFTERLVISSEQAMDNIPKELLKNLLENLSLVLGVSYYKLFCPQKIIFETIRLSREQAEFWNTVYTKGLGEFFYQNKIDFRGLINFPFFDSETAKAVPFSRQDRSLVGIGGGKDSVVTGELLKAAKKPFASFVLTRHPVRDEVLSVMGSDVLTVQKIIDPLLLELNKRHDTYNGHFPVSAQYAFIATFLAAIYDYRFVIVSNEYSANYGNVEYLGMEVNHQWSKSFEFETMFQNYVKEFVTPDITYFSLLRELTELVIVKEFVNYPQYFPHFSSCNRNFTIYEPRSGKKWCGECAKCAFAFVMLAAFLPKEQVVGIFGENLFAKESLLETFKELLGVVNIKPFDCVGTPDEVRVAFNLALQKGEYTDDVVMRFFQEEVLLQTPEIEKLQEKVFERSDIHRIPEEFRGIVHK